jgi:hypothetical protein
VSGSSPDPWRPPQAEVDPPDRDDAPTEGRRVGCIGHWLIALGLLFALCLLTVLGWAALLFLPSPFR